MTRPGKITIAADGKKKFSAAVFEVIRTKFAPQIGGNVNDGVRRVAEHVAPRMPADVTVGELEDVIPQLVAKFVTESSSSNGHTNDGRLPLDEDAQKCWDLGRWRGKLTVHGLEAKYKGVAVISKEMVDAYSAELVAEKEKIAKIANEQPDGGVEVCGAPVHKGAREPFQLTKRFRPEKDQVTGEWRPKKHPQGDDLIQVGNIFIVIAEDGTASKVFFCPECRDEMWQLARNSAQKATFYTRESAERKIGKMRESVEGQKSLAAQLQSAGNWARGTRKGGQGDWRQTRAGGKR